MTRKKPIPLKGIRKPIRFNGFTLTPIPGGLLITAPEGCEIDLLSLASVDKQSLQIVSKPLNNVRSPHHLPDRPLPG